MGSIIEGSLQRRIEFLEQEAQRRWTFMQQEADMLGRAADSLGSTVEEALKRLLPHDPDFVADKMGTPRAAPSTPPPPTSMPIPVAPDDGDRPPVEHPAPVMEFVTIPIVPDDGDRPLEEKEGDRDE